MGKKKKRLEKQRRTETQAKQRKWKRNRDKDKRVKSILAQIALEKHKKPYKPRTKKQEYDEHDMFFRSRLEGYKRVRPAVEWQPKNYNVYKQRLSFLRWVLCKYYVPAFLLDCFIEPTIKPPLQNGPAVPPQIEKANNQLMFRDWCAAVGHGWSLYKLAKDILTKKECHYFLNFTDGTAESNIWRARCIRVGLPNKFVNVVVSTMVRRGIFIRDKQWLEFVEFLGRNYEAFDKNALHEIMDFLYAQFDQIRTLKGRTVSSLTRMSNDWHRVMGRTKHTGAYVQWEGSGIPYWDFRFKGDPTYWFITEITDSKDLYAEGNKLKHCVGSYTSLCREGRANIFSLRKKAFKEDNIMYRCVTIEVKSGHIYQTRRIMNRTPTAEEKSIIQRWAIANSLHYERSSFTRAW